MMMRSIARPEWIRFRMAPIRSVRTVQQIQPSLSVLAGGLLMRGVIMLAGSLPAGRPEDYFRFASPALGRKEGEIGSS
jgi:hypothetical protein